MTRLPVHPQGEVLCQTGSQSCAACCGLFNFADRSPEALHQRLLRRTHAVREAGWEMMALREVAARLSTEEAPALLFKAVRTCPLAGYVDENARRVGCLIHPLRHPTGEDLRDLGAYGDRNICAGHLCAPHSWLGPVERALIECAPSWRAYSMAVGESGFVKALLGHLAARRGGEVQLKDLGSDAVRAGAAKVFALFDHWAFADEDPRRFGGFSFAGDDAYTRSVPSVARFSDLMSRHEATMLDCLGTLAETESQAVAAVTALREVLRPLDDALS
ncbi:MAG: hypothetical protein AB2A00_28880 [Myxococcota bacterium]